MAQKNLEMERQETGSSASLDVVEENTSSNAPEVKPELTDEEILADKAAREDEPEVKDVSSGILSSKRAAWAFIYIISAAVSLFARLINIGFSDNGRSPVFDEKHYATQAYQMLFVPGHQESFPGYGLIVHPPLGKTLISLGEKVFGYTPLGWRIVPIIAGVIIVLLLMRMVHIVTGSMPAVVFTAVLANLEGTQFFMSRIAMLDIFTALFVTCMAFCIIKDYYTDTSDTPWHLRGWLLMSGVFAGLAMAVKVSGAFYAAYMGVMLVAIVTVTSKSVRETLKALGMGLIFYLVVPLTIFMLSWVPWFANENSVYRHIAEADKIEHPLPDWIANILPDSVNSFMSYQIGVAKFHTGLKSGVGFDNVHPWESKPDEWFLGGRPMLFLNSYAEADTVVFGSGNGETKMVLFANMAVWFLIIPMIVWGTYQIIKNEKPEWFVVLSGLAVGIIPWFIAYDRQQYFFYTVSWSMFVILGVSLMLYEISQILESKTKMTERSSLIVTYIPYTILIATIFALYIPWMYNVPASHDYHNGLTLFDSWNQLEKY